MAPDRRKTLAIVVKGYPRLSETFIAQEILALQEAGFPLQLVSLRRPTDKAVHPVHKQITAPVTYLPEYLHDEPGRVFKAVLAGLVKPRFWGAFGAFLRDVLRDPTRNRVRRFGQGCVMAAEIAPKADWLHAHFIHTPASATRYASLVSGLPWSCSAHAKDIWTSDDWDLSDKLAQARWTVTCTASGHAHLQSLAAKPESVHLSYHGIDLERFPSPPTRQRAEANALKILAVGRAVEKKGFDLLLSALVALSNDIAWSLDHIGGGEKLDELKAQAEQLGIAGNISWHGAKPQDEVLAAYRAADVFALPCRIAADGDRDGLPNVLMEAQTQRLACLSTDISGVGELIVDGETGILCPPEDVDCLRAALERLARDPAYRERLAEAGEKRVRARFDHDKTAAELIGLFDAALGRDAGA
ncbi:glycosyltransferase family 4 protein [Tepidamorphus sp. 3E244]|uniref:glycosyltransferase family 4 protein n=1 Tax=Tepidamorphus sp. 3E244 TaxID=3385498 RepID=UPI0038FBEE0D